MWSEELKRRTRRIFEKRYKKRLTDGEVDAILRSLTRFVQSLR
jgi:hypothetical protein